MRSSRESKLQLGNLEYLPVSWIKPSQWGIRRGRSPILGQSVKHHGVLQNIIVRPIGKDRYQVVSGDGRLAMARGSKIKTIPALVVKTDERTAFLLHGIENICRDDFNPIEEGAFFSQLRKQGFRIPQIVNLFKGKYGETTISTRIEMYDRLTEKGKDAVAKGLVNIQAVVHAFDALPEEKAKETVEYLAGKRLNVEESVAYIDALRPIVELHEKAKVFRDHASPKPNSVPQTKDPPKKFFVIYKLEFSGSVVGIEDSEIHVYTEDKRRVHLLAELEDMKQALLIRLRPGDRFTIMAQGETALTPDGKVEASAEAVVPV